MKTKTKKKAVKSEVIARATLRGVRISPQKARLVIDLIRGKGVEDALNTLRFLPKKAAKLSAKILESAIFNAKESKGADVDRLIVVGAYVNMGVTIKRFMPRAQGRATPIKKRSSHITIELGEK